MRRKEYKKDCSIESVVAGSRFKISTTFLIEEKSAMERGDEVEISEGKIKIGVCVLEKKVNRCLLLSSLPFSLPLPPPLTRFHLPLFPQSCPHFPTSEDLGFPKSEKTSPIY